MKRFLILLGFLILVGASAVYGYNRRVPNPDPNHNHADFAVWINGTQIDFAQEKYMTEELTTEELEALSKQAGGVEKDLKTLKQYLHLHDGNGHVLHRHKPGLGFGDFLKSVGFTLTADCLTADTGTKTCNLDDKKWQLFVNGQEVLPFDANFVFADDDQILLTYGVDDAQLQREMALMTNDACKYSKTCPGRGAPPTESCIADPTVPCTAP